MKIITELLNTLKDKKAIHDFIIKDDRIGLQITEDPEFLFLEISKTIGSAEDEQIIRNLTVGPVTLDQNSFLQSLSHF